MEQELPWLLELSTCVFVISPEDSQQPVVFEKLVQHMTENKLAQVPCTQSHALVYTCNGNMRALT